LTLGRLQHLRGRKRERAATLAQNSEKAAAHEGSGNVRREKREKTETKFSSWGRKINRSRKITLIAARHTKGGKTRGMTEGGVALEKRGQKKGNMKGKSCLCRGPRHCAARRRYTLELAKKKWKGSGTEGEWSRRSLRTDSVSNPNAGRILVPEENSKTKK